MIFASDTPLVVPAPVWVIICPELDVSVSVFALLFLNLNVNDPDTLKFVGVPDNNGPNPKSCASTEEDTVVDPADTEV